MAANFLSIPRELRNNIYEQLLVLEHPICPTRRPWLYDSQTQALTLGILRVNKTVHLEASSILYGHNRFDLTMCRSEELTSFLEQIGRNNAGSILHICIGFPQFGPSTVTLEDDSVCILAEIQNNCTKLVTLTTPLESAGAISMADAQGDAMIIPEVLDIVDARFRAIPSLQEIIVEVYESVRSSIPDQLNNHGWTVSIIEDPEVDYERGYSDMEDDHDDYDDYRYDSGGDGYDIDNDSDFWRRAGD